MRAGILKQDSSSRAAKIERNVHSPKEAKFTVVNRARPLIFMYINRGVITRKDNTLTKMVAKIGI